MFSDECYVEFTWSGRGRTILERGTDGVVAVHSLSKRSNLAGLRVGFYAGDAELVHYLQEVRKHVGMMVPGPAQAAGVAALDDDAHVEVQRERVPLAPRADGRRARNLVGHAGGRARRERSICGSPTTTAGRSPSGSPSTGERSSAPASSTVTTGGPTSGSPSCNLTIGSISSRTACAWGSHERDITRGGT